MLIVKPLTSLRLRDLVTSPNIEESKWLSNLESTKWLQHIQAILQEAVKVIILVLCFVSEPVVFAILLRHNTCYDVTTCAMTSQHVL